MNKKFYQLANNLTSEYHTNSNVQAARLSDLEIKKYSDTVLTRIRNNKYSTTPKKRSTADIPNTGNRYAASHGRRTIRKTIQYAAPAACIALVLGVTVFSSDVHAAIEHIRWSLSSALGLSGDLADYRDIINTTVTDHGYMITLQEVIATDEKLVVNYTIQREDGEFMGEIPLMPDSDLLYINGKNATDSVSGGSGFIDDEHTIVGVSRTFDVPGIDMAQENTYQLKLESLDNYDLDTKIDGTWNFSFTADGSDIITDTTTLPISQTFTVAEGVTVTLEELTMNELEQRISYRMEGSTDYLLQLTATDSTGTQAQFDTKIFQGADGIGYMQNQEIIDDGRISESAETVTMTLYAVEIPKESGRMNDNYVQLGEPFEVKLR
ncbi:MAG: DUF4179 domain-containing protein [Lachnospiraceae bacterium]|nr:DUF4179 domain-containing protein [Lachnospiraceae bacterium]